MFAECYTIGRYNGRCGLLLPEIGVSFELILFPTRFQVAQLILTNGVNRSRLVFVRLVVVFQEL